MLAEIQAGYFELFGSRRRAFREFRGSSVAISGIVEFNHRFLSSVLAYVGLDPRKDIQWVQGGTSTKAMRLFAEGKAEAFFGFPPHPQELRAEGSGRSFLTRRKTGRGPKYF